MNKIVAMQFQPVFVSKAMLKNTSRTYGLIAKVFHWLIFVLLVMAVVMGNVLSSMPDDPSKFQAMATHKTFGSMILILVLLRLLWKLVNESPSLPEKTPIHLIFLAELMHWALYLLMIFQPLSGIVMSQASGYPVSIFGIFDIPVIAEKNNFTADLAHDAHALIWIFLFVAVVGHVGAALYHHFIKKDRTLRQMTCG